MRKKRFCKWPGCDKWRFNTRYCRAHWRIVSNTPYKVRQLPVNRSPYLGDMIVLSTAGLNCSRIAEMLREKYGDEKITKNAVVGVLWRWRRAGMPEPGPPPLVLAKRIRLREVLERPVSAADLWRRTPSRPSAWRRVGLL